MGDQKIPIVYYHPDSGRIEIGTAEIDGDVLTGTITNSKFATLISPENPPGSFSVQVDPNALEEGLEKAEGE